jgi:hypothetical protein
MTVIRIPAGPLRGVALETRRRTFAERLRGTVRVLTGRRPSRPEPPAA